MQRPHLGGRREQLVLLQEPSAQHAANCVVIAGLPWHFTVAALRDELARHGPPSVVRFYEDPVNGRSRGIALVRIGKLSGPAVEELAAALSTVGGYAVTTRVLHVSPQWDPDTAAPRLPDDAFAGTISRGVPFGFGPAMAPVRGGGTATVNTATEAGAEELERQRKKQRLEDGHGVDEP